MSVFNELLPKLYEISNSITKNFNDELKAAFESFDKFEEEYLNTRSKAREKTLKDKNPVQNLQSIHEDDDEAIKDTDSVESISSSKSTITDVPNNLSSTKSSPRDKPRRASKKRSKNEVDGISSPEQDKRQKRSASVKAQTIITKQVNVNLNQKMRREEGEKRQSSRRQRKDDKENAPLPVNIEIKQEKISLPPEPTDLESLPLDIVIKQQLIKDEIAMPPPAIPVPKPRKAAAREKMEVDSAEEQATGKRRTRTRKNTDTVPPPVAATRSTRASSRSRRATETDTQPEEPPVDTRPKRTRAKKKVSGVPNPEVERVSAAPPDSLPASPAEKPRPKRTRRVQKAAEKQEDVPEDLLTPIEPTVSPPEEPSSLTGLMSPILQKEIPKKGDISKTNLKQESFKSKLPDTVDTGKDLLNETRVLPQNGVCNMDQTVVLSSGVYNHAPLTPKTVRSMNETVVLDTNSRETIVLEKLQNQLMNATVVIDKDSKPTNITDDNSLLTDDSDVQEALTPPKQTPPVVQPSSAVKEKVQQFEEMASRVTRTKTRALAKKQEEETETHTPPDKVVKQVLSADTLNKMNSMIFNGKQISSSASKPRANLPPMKSMIPASTSKLSGINRAREMADDILNREKESARKKKEAILEAKRELHKRKREEKMAAAAAAREQAERERRAAMEAAARERMEKQAYADQGKLDRQREVERKKQEQARKVAEAEERRRAEEQARQLRLEEEQRKADAARQKQLEDARAAKKEAEMITKEMEKRQKEYIEKQKMKHRFDDKSHTPLKMGTPGGYRSGAMDPVYMADGFQFLNSDEEAEPLDIPTPGWSTSKARKQTLYIQCQLAQHHIDKLFSVRVHSPDLRDIFPNIERSRLKRTSSAVWRTPPGRLPALKEQ